MALLALLEDDVHPLELSMLAVVDMHAGAANGPANGSDYDVGRVEYDVASGLIIYEEYHPFGTSAYRAVDSTIQVSAKRYRYAAAERDEETGLDHMGLRYYAPWLGRWTSADPIGISGGINLYEYAASNPVAYIDPSGQDPQLEIDKYTVPVTDAPHEHISFEDEPVEITGKPLAKDPYEAIGLPGAGEQQRAFVEQERQHISARNAEGTAAARQAIENQETAEAAGRIAKAGAPVVAVAEIAARIIAPAVTTAVDVIDALVSDNPEDRAQAVVGLTQTILEKKLPFLKFGRLGGGKEPQALPESQQKALPPGEPAALPAAPTRAAEGPSVGDLRAAGRKDAHHVIQDAAVRDLPGYQTNAAPGVQLPGPSTRRGTPHYEATQVQRETGGGTYAAERRIGYKALRRADFTPAEARAAIERADEFFRNLGVGLQSPTRVPGNRRRPR